MCIRDRVNAEVEDYVKQRLIDCQFKFRLDEMCIRDSVYNGRLPVHVRCLLDEFANIGQIPKFDKLIATIRSREISASIILQSQSQLKTIYKDAADTIVGNCDCTLFLGGKEKSTLKELSEILGKETIDLYNTDVYKRQGKGKPERNLENQHKQAEKILSEEHNAEADGGLSLINILSLGIFMPFFGC